MDKRTVRVLGIDPGLRFMCHLWEPLRVAHKPLVVYLVAEVREV